MDTPRPSDPIDSRPDRVVERLDRALPPAVRGLVETLEARGHETWVVGGAVRDAALGEPSEWDLATRARPRQVRSVFRRTIPVGVEHGTVGVLANDGVMYEVTTFRRDVRPLGRKAVVEFSDSLEEDLARRDFTLNAMAWHPLNGSFQDPFGGMADMEGRVLRTVGEPHARFREDYLRVLRALRFAGRYGLWIEPDTWTALVEGVPLLQGLSGERVRDELLKVLRFRVPSAALALYALSGALEGLIPELDRERLADALLTADRVRPHRSHVRLAALLDAAPPTPSGRAATAARLRTLRFSNDEIQAVEQLLAVRVPRTPLSATESRHWLSAGGLHRLPDRIRLALAVSRRDRERWGRDTGELVRSVSALRAQVQAGVPLSVRDLAIDGADLKALGLRPGPVFGEILDTLLNEVLEDPTRGTRAALLERARSWLAGPGAGG